MSRTTFMSGAHRGQKRMSDPRMWVPDGRKLPGRCWEPGSSESICALHCEAVSPASVCSFLSLLWNHLLSLHPGARNAKTRHQRPEKDLRQARGCGVISKTMPSLNKGSIETLSRKPKYTHVGKYIMAGVIPEQEQLKDVLQHIHCKVQDGKMADTFLDVLIWRSRA